LRNTRINNYFILKISPQVVQVFDSPR